MSICRPRKLNNKGAALVMVIVVIGFVSILTTILLYLANMNYQMKATDFKTKVSFYGAETPLEELRMLMTKDVSSAAKDAYQTVELQYAGLTADERKLQYQSEFVSNYLAIWESRTEDASNSSVHWDWMDGLPRAFQAASPHSTEYHILEKSNWVDNKCNDTDCTKNYHIIMDDTNLSTNRLKVYSDASGMKFEMDEFMVVYTEGAYTSIVSTKYSIRIPDIDWTIEESNDSWNDATEVNGKHNVHNEVGFDTCVIYKDWKKQ